MNLAALAYLARVGLREVERRDGVVDYQLRQAVLEVELEARAARFDPSVVASVTSISDAPSRRSWVRCVDCGRSTDRPRRGLCDACRKAEDRRRAG